MKNAQTSAEIVIPEPFLFANYEIVLTWDCNLQCSYCYERRNVAPSSSSGQFSPENVDQLVAFIVSSHDPKSSDIHIQFFGGEPTLCLETIKQIINKLEPVFTKQFPTQKLSYGMTTNAVNITRKDAQYFAQKNFGLLISLDGPQDVHDRNRGTGTFEQVMLRLAYLRALNIFLQVRMTVALNTIADFARSFEFINSLGLPFLWQLDTKDEYAPGLSEQFVGDLHKLYAKPRQVFDTTIQRFKDHKNKIGYCINPYQTITIRNDGSLIICSRADWPLGDIWRGITEYEKVKELPIYGGNVKPECSACLSFEYCKGGCLGEHVEGLNDYEIEYLPNRRFCKTQHLMHIFLNEELLQKQVL